MHCVGPTARQPHHSLPALWSQQPAAAELSDKRTVSPAVMTVISRPLKAPHGWFATPVPQSFYIFSSSRPWLMGQDLPTKNMMLKRKKRRWKVVLGLLVKNIYLKQIKSSVSIRKQSCLSADWKMKTRILDHVYTLIIGRFTSHHIIIWMHTLNLILHVSPLS